MVANSVSWRNANRLDLAALALLALTGIAQPTAASAQGFFGSVFGSMSSHRDASRGGASAYAPDDTSLHSRPARSNYAGGSGVYCVRLCDGRYFPVPKLGGQVSSAKVCNAMCPMAATKVFNGSDPTKSVASDGTRYDDLDNALAYRTKVVPSCSCTGNGPGGLARIDIESDPTLRNGDVVAKETGLEAFISSGSLPHKASDFTPIESSSKVAAGLRQLLADVRINNTVQYTGPVRNLAAADIPAVAGEAADAKKPRRAKMRVVVNPARPAPQQANAWGGNSWGNWGGGWRTSW